MSMLLKLCATAILACVCQTNLSQYIRIAGVAPDMALPNPVGCFAYRKNIILDEKRM